MLKSEFETLSKNADSNSNDQALDSEIENLKNSIKTLSDQITLDSSTKLEKRKNLDNLLKEFDEKSVSLKKEGDEPNELDIQIKDIKKKIEALDNEILNLTAGKQEEKSKELLFLEKTFDDKKSELQKIREGKNSDGIEISSLKEKIKQLDQNIIDSKSEMGKEKAKVAFELEEKRKILHSNSLQNDTEAKELNSLKSQLQDIISSVGQGQTDLELKKSEKNKVVEEVERLRSSAPSKKFDVEELEVIDNEITGMLVEKETLLGRIKDLQSKKDELDSKKRKGKSLENEIEALRNRKEHLLELLDDKIEPGIEADSLSPEILRRVETIRKQIENLAEEDQNPLMNSTNFTMERDLMQANEDKTM